MDNIRTIVTTSAVADATRLIPDMRFMRGGNVYCRNCGASVPADSKFCKECGSKVAGSSRASVLTPEDLEPVAGDVNQERLTKLLDMAFWHNDVGNVDSAILACEAALKINPSSTTAHSLLSTLFEKNGDDERALEHLEAVMALNPDSTADMARLDQLKRGVHAKAISPPPGYRWLPPALSGVTLPGLKSRINAAMPVNPANPQMVPIYYSAIAVAIVIGVGIALMRNGGIDPPHVAAHPATYPTTNAAPTPAPNNLMVATADIPSTWSQVTSKNSGTSNGKKVDSDLPDNSDPFRPQPVTPDEIAQEFPQYATKADPVSRQTPTLPSLNSNPSLTVVPLATPPGGVAPAQVNVPPGQGETDVRPVSPQVSMDNIPRHTVEVPLGQSSASAQDQSLSAVPPPSPYAQAQAEPQPTQYQSSSDPGTIHVSVHEAPTSPNASVEVNQGSNTSAVPSVNVDEGQAYQQYALSLQERGDFRGAKAAYERAIRSYTARLRSGQDTDDVQRGLKACKTGLEICQQSVQ